MRRTFLAGLVLSAVASSGAVRADKPSATENYGACHGQNRHALNQTGAPGPAFSSIYAGLPTLPGELGELFEEAEGEPGPNARQDENELLRSDLGCGGIKPGQ